MHERRRLQGSITLRSHVMRSHSPQFCIHHGDELFSRLAIAVRHLAEHSGDIVHVRKMTLRGGEANPENRRA